MRQAKAELYVHIVWATEGRRELMKPPVHRALYRCVEGQARQLGCTVLAIGGVADHVHMVLRMPAKLSLAQLLQ
jgi:REP element-mobilizing transposase RayT